MEFATREPILKGWSADRKYHVTDREGRSYLLRMSDKSQYDRKRRSFAGMQRVAALGVPMCKPIAFGMVEDEVYSLQGWIDGEDAEAVIGTLPEQRHYAYGLDAGRLLRIIHSIPAPATLEPWEIRFNRKIDRKIGLYNGCPLKYSDGGAFLNFVEKNRHLLKNRPQVYQHGDYHIGNMMLDRTGCLTIIDFDRDDYGDPWEEFNRIVWCAQKAPAFAVGMVDGYFEGEVPAAFWDLLALYIAVNTLSSLPWAVPFGAGEIDTMQTQAEEILRWYDNMTRTIPAWYRRSEGSSL